MQTIGGRSMKFQKEVAETVGPFEKFARIHLQEKET